MRLTSRWLLLIATALCVCPFAAYASDISAQLPAECKSRASTVALLDCLQNQHDILQAVLAYEEMLTRIEIAKSERTEAISAPPAPTDSPDEDLGLTRASWFDENLQVYAIVGDPEQLTAYARLNGHEYRLKTGDVIRLARVTSVHPRGIELSVANYEMSIGLSGLPGDEE